MWIPACRRRRITVWRNATRHGQPCRAGGFNAGSFELFIAALSIHHDAELITFDADYIAITRVSTLRIQHLSGNPSRSHDVSVPM
ncbi:MAG: PIN domain nuclease [Verrucomicrobia bacterium]|nr:MAG: PIN domain nuclease [Verrucomicrobiota bacterium]